MQIRRNYDILRLSNEFKSLRQLFMSLMPEPDPQADFLAKEIIAFYYLRFRNPNSLLIYPIINGRERSSGFLHHREEAK